MPLWLLAAGNVGFTILAQVSPDVGWIERAGIIGLLCLNLFAFLRGWVHTDREYQALLHERDSWRDVALRGTTTAEDAAHTARELLQQSDPRAGRRLP